MKRWAQLTAGLLLALAAVIGAFRLAGHSAAIRLESPAKSRARVVAERVEGASRLMEVWGSFALYGTLALGETADAFDFVAPMSADVTVTLSVKADAWLGGTPPRLTVMSTSSGNRIDGAEPKIRRSTLDWRVLEPTSVEAVARVPLEEGTAYALVVSAGADTGETLPYTVSVSMPGAPQADDLALANIRATARLWWGSYGQRSPRLLPSVLALMVLVLLLVAPVRALAAGSNAAVRLARDGVRRSATRPESPAQEVRPWATSSPAMTTPRATHRPAPPAEVPPKVSAQEPAAEPPAPSSPPEVAAPAPGTSPAEQLAPVLAEESISAAPPNLESAPVDAPAPQEGEAEQAPDDALEHPTARRHRWNRARARDEGETVSISDRLSAYTGDLTPETPESGTREDATDQE